MLKELTQNSGIHFNFNKFILLLLCVFLFFVFCRVNLLLGYSPEELLGRSIYGLCHTLDLNCLRKNHINRTYYY